MTTPATETVPMDFDTIDTDDDVAMDIDPTDDSAFDAEVHNHNFTDTICAEKRRVWRNTLVNLIVMLCITVTLCVCVCVSVEVLAGQNTCNRVKKKITDTYNTPIHVIFEHNQNKIRFEFNMA